MGRKRPAGTFGCCGKWGARTLAPRIAEQLRGRTGILANSRRAKGVHGMGTGESPLLRAAQFRRALRAAFAGSRAITWPLRVPRWRPCCQVIAPLTSTATMPAEACVGLS